MHLIIIAAASIAPLNISLTARHIRSVVISAGLHRENAGEGLTGEHGAAVMPGELERGINRPAGELCIIS